MARFRTRTDQLDRELYRQLLRFCEDDFRSFKSFHDKFLPDMCYQAFQAALRGDFADPELIQQISDALDIAERQQLRASYTACPYCKQAYN